MTGEDGFGGIFRSFVVGPCQVAVKNGIDELDGIFEKIVGASAGADRVGRLVRAGVGRRFVGLEVGGGSGGFEGVVGTDGGLS